MDNKPLKYLKQKGFTEPSLVNGLFVAAFASVKGWEVERCTVIKNLKRIESQTVTEFIHILNENSFGYTLEELIQLFEFVVSPSDRIVTGAVYTPPNIRKIILRNTMGDGDLQEMRIADVSCGCGGFLMDVARLIHSQTGKSYLDIFRDNLYGIDIQEYSVDRTKIILSLLAISEGEDEDYEFNLLCRDSLDYLRGEWDEKYSGFDVIVGNPPYVCSRKLSEETRNKLKGFDVCSSGHPDLYIPFFKIAVDLLSDRGIMGYITMNSFMRSVNGRSIRKYFSNNRFSISIVDFRGFQVFESKNTYTCLFFLNKGIKSDAIYYSVDASGAFPRDYHYRAIPYSEIDDDRGWALNGFESTKALERAGVQIKDYCPSRHGIATLSNETYIFSPVAEDDKYYYLENAGITYPIEKGLCRDIVNPNNLNAKVGPSLSLEKVVFPYHIDSGKAIIYEPDEMSRLFPMACAYLNMKKGVLLTRDKNKTSEYPQWYAFGRTQSLVLPRYKLFFPKFANRPLRCVICDDPDLMLYNGLAFINSDIKKLRILKSIIESQLFWDYVQANGKPYASGFYSLSGVDIKHFGIPSFSEEEEEELLSIKDRNARESWLRQKYGLD